MLSKRAFLANLVCLSAVFGSAQIVRDITLDIGTGPSGMNFQTELSLQLQGENGATIGRASFRPARVGSFGANTSESVSIRLDQDVKVRKIKRLILGVRGTRPGNSRFADAWDLDSLTLRSGGTVVWRATGIGTRFTELRTSWRSADWASYDPTGEKTPAARWQFVTNTGDDDLRTDHTVSALVIFKDGTASAFSIRNVPNGRVRTDELSVPAGTQSIENVKSVLLVSEVMLGPEGAGVSGGSLGVLTGHESDKWKVSSVVLRARLSDGDIVNKRLRGLEGDLRMGQTKQADFSTDSILLRSELVRPGPDTPVTVLVITPNGVFNSNTGGDFGDLRAAFRFTGRTDPLNVVYRVQGTDRSPFNWQAAGWKGSSFRQGYDWSKTTSMFRTVRPWSDANGEIGALQLSLATWNTGAAYRGSSRLPILGYIVMQAKRANQPDYSHPNGVNDWQVLGYAFNRTMVLSASNPVVTFPVSYRRGIPIRPVRPGGLLAAWNEMVR